MSGITKAAQDALTEFDAFVNADDSRTRIVGLITKMDALRAALQDKAVEVADVARYRAIRDGLVYIEPHESGEIYVAGVTGVYTKSGDEFDAAIDAITASQQKGGSSG